MFRSIRNSVAKTIQIVHTNKQKNAIFFFKTKQIHCINYGFSIIIVKVNERSRNSDKAKTQILSSKSHRNSSEYMQSISNTSKTESIILQFNMIFISFFVCVLFCIHFNRIFAKSFYVANFFFFLNKLFYFFTVCFTILVC